jgi:NTP pyrophosphatase (non-canonical NTP hydrolase)
MKEDLLKIIKHYGVNNQQRKLEEEIFELQESIIKYELDETGLETKKHIEEEFADVCVILEQFKAYYNLDNKKIVDIMQTKIARQLRRIENENI